jgi:hypothetical protein
MLAVNIQSTDTEKRNAQEIFLAGCGCIFYDGIGLGCC